MLNPEASTHPRFCCDDRVVVFATTVRGRIDLAMVRTFDLAEQLQA
jgi:hypothetical protein